MTPLGHSTWETFTALLAGRSLADRTANLPPDTAPVDLVRAIGCVRVAQHVAADPAVELAERAAREACFAAGVNLTDLPTFLGTSKGAVHSLTQAAASLYNPPKRRPTAEPLPAAADHLEHPAAVALGPHGYLAQQLAQRTGLRQVSHHVAACASSLTALDAARRWLTTSKSPNHQIAKSPNKHALILTAEAALLPQFIHSYRKLGVLAPLCAADYRQLPLDEARQGFMLTEAAAAVVLRALEPGEAPKAGEIELVDTGVACEAFDLVRSDAHMPALRHLAKRLLAGREIDMIHPHAPGTTDHDPAELAAYNDALGSQVDQPDYYACKGALGHALGAAGLTALTLACLCLQAGRRPTMPWITRPLPGIDPASRPCSRTGTHAIFAAGFAGHTAGAVVRRS